MAIRGEEKEGVEEKKREGKQEKGKAREGIMRDRKGHHEREEKNKKNTVGVTDKV